LKKNNHSVEDSVAVIKANIDNSWSSKLFQRTAPPPRVQQQQQQPRPRPAQANGTSHASPKQQPRKEPVKELPAPKVDPQGFDAAVDAELNALQAKQSALLAAKGLTGRLSKANAEIETLDAEKKTLDARQAELTAELKKNSERLAEIATQSAQLHQEKRSVLVEMEAKSTHLSSQP
jgi:hypothetical protein